MARNDKYELMNTVAATIKAYADIAGSFTREQAYFMRSDKKPSTVDKAIYTMVRNNQNEYQKYKLFVKASDENMDINDAQHFKVNGVEPYNEDMSNALWPLLYLVKKNGIIYNNQGEAETIWMTQGDRPSAISFILQDTLYDIVPVGEYNKAILIQLEKEYRKNQERNAGKQTYIFLISDVEVIKNLPNIEAPHMFVVINDVTADNIMSWYDANGNLIEEG